MIARTAMALGLLVGLTGCDKIDAEGIERRLELLEQQQREAAEAKDELEKRLAAAEDAAKSHDAVNAETLAKLETRLTEQQQMITDVELKLDEPPKPEIRAGRPDPSLRYRVDIGDSHIRGPSDAKITIVIFSDFQCPFCKRVQTTLTEVEKEYGKDVRLVAKHNPLPMHHNAMSAAMAAEAAGKQGKFWEMNDLLYENNRDLSRANYIKWAKQIGCTGSEFERDLDDEDLENRIKDDQALSTKVGARGTPAFFVNGRFLSGAQPLASFKAVIDEEMKEADARIARGTAKSSVYSELMREAKSGV